MSWLLGLFGGSSVGIWIVGAVFALGAAGTGVQTWRLHTEQAAREHAEATLAKKEVAWEKERGAAADAAAAQERSNRALEKTWAKQREEVINAAIEKTEAAIVATAATRRAADRLRVATANAVASAGRAASDPAASEGCRAAAKTADLLSVVQGRIAEAARGIGEYADAERIGHEACVASPHAAKVTP